jgi:hypothetical protein
MTIPGMSAAAVTPAGRWRRRIQSVAVAALLTAGIASQVAGCGSQPRQAPLPDSNLGFKPLCDPDPGAVFPEAPAYRGPGPHLFHTLVLDNTNSLGPIIDLNNDETMDTPWLRLTTGSYQLLACAVRVSVSQGSVATCRYQQGQGPLGQPGGPALNFGMYRATYQITLRELRTGRTVAAAQLTGDDVTCPSTVGHDTTEVYSWPSASQWEHAFGRYVTRPA